MATDYAEFAQWLKDLLESKGMSQAELSRLSGVDRGYISRVLAMERPPSNSFLMGIAEALDIPREEVLAKAGLLKPINHRTELLERLAHVAAQLSDSELAYLIETTRSRVEWYEKQRATGGKTQTGDESSPVSGGALAD